MLRLWLQRVRMKKNGTKKVKHPDGWTEIWPEEFPDELIKASWEASKRLNISTDVEDCPVCGYSHS